MWKDIGRFIERIPRGIYFVNEFGDVKSIDRVRTDVLGRKVPKKGTIMRPGMSKCGYKRVGIYSMTIPVHRLVSLAFVKNPQNKPCVNHKDGDKLNNHVSNLEWVTHRENNNHAIKTGLKKTCMGERHHFATASDSLVKEARRLVNEEGLTHTRASELLGVNRSSVSRWCANKSRV
jgi:HNH endonuclease/NUMOD4 motif